MSGEVTVKKSQVGTQEGVAEKFAATAKVFSDPPPAGLNPGTVTALTHNLKGLRALSESCVTLAKQGKDAVVDIQDGDEESGEKIQSC